MIMVSESRGHENGGPEDEMTTFNVGDRVRRIDLPAPGVPLGSEWTVSEVAGKSIRLTAGGWESGWFNPYRFELVTPAPSEGHPTHSEGDLRVYDGQRWRSMSEAWVMLEDKKKELDEFKAKVVEVVRANLPVGDLAPVAILQELGLAPTRYRVTFEVEAESLEEAFELAHRQPLRWTNTVEKIEEE